MNKPFAFALFAMAASLLSAEDLLLNGDHTVTVGAGSTQTISDKVTGPGRIILLGGGTLVLSNSANDFTGGVIVSNGVLRADASGAFGTGPITLEGEADCRTVQFNATKGVFPNSITLKDKTSSSTYPAVHAMQPTTLNGDIVMDPALAAESNSNSLYLSIDKSMLEGDTFTAMMDVKGECNVGNGMLILAGGSDDNVHVAYYRLYGKITAGRCTAGNNVNRKGAVYLYNSDNSIVELRIETFNLHCGAENVFYGATVQFNYNWQWGGNRSQGRLYCDGYNQTARYFHSGTTVGINHNISRNDNDATVASDNLSLNRSAVITLIGKSNATSYPNAYTRLIGNLSVVVDKLPDALDTYQRFCYFENTMTGDLTVKGGNLELKAGVTFPNVKNVNVSGGTFYMQTVTNALPSLAKMTVSGGTFQCDANCVNPISYGLADMHLSGEGKLKFGNGITNTVRKLYVNGEYMPAGTYTKANLPAMEPSGDTGALVALRGRAGAFMIVR
jgi:autotransporter-associated beta strand protein